MDSTPTWLDRVRKGLPIQMPDENFFAAVWKARGLATAFNQLPHDAAEPRLAALKSLFGSFGEGSWVEPTLNVDLGFLTEIGERTFINLNCTLIDTYPISIGSDVQIGPNCLLSAASHPVEFRERKIFASNGAIIGGITTGARITIEDGVWLGGNVCVMPGITIGARSVIGAGSVVTRSIPPDVVAAGNPCRVLRQINQP